MNVWELLLTFEIVLVSVVLLFVFVGWRKKARIVSKAHSPEHRLKIPNVWTEIQHVKHGGSTQMMRMTDGHFILLSVGVDTCGWQKRCARKIIYSGWMRESTQRLQFSYIAQNAGATTRDLP